MSPEDKILSHINNLGRIMEKERETVTWEETAYSNYLSVEAIVNLLIRKKLMTQEEILNEIRSLKHEHHSKPN